MSTTKETATDSNLGLELAVLLGLPTDSLVAFNVRVRAQSVVTVTAVHYIYTPEEETKNRFKHVLSQYKLEKKSEPKP